MNIFKYIPIGFIGIIFFSTNCITPFEPLGVQDTAGILVVEGMILETGTTIKLSRTVEINTKSDFEMEDLSHARVQVIDDGNNVVAVAEQQIIDEKINPGTYVVNSKITFTPGMKYALAIQIGEKQYQSSFVSPVRTPEIDAITWKFYDDKSMDIMVSTHDPEGEINYYRWAFEEDWEIQAAYFSPFVYDPLNRTLIEQSLTDPNNTYYCWDSDVSKSILLGASDQYTEAVIKNKRIHRILPDNSRFSFLYSILVKQYGIEKEAYHYFENVQKNIEQGGSIFSPQPSEIRGNINCLSNPDEPVIGYIVATKEVVARIFIDMETNEGEDWHNCGDLYEFSFANLFAAYINGLGISYVYTDEEQEDEVFIYVCAPLRCTDCTQRGGTKNKPDFWPNDHQ